MQRITLATLLLSCVAGSELPAAETVDYLRDVKPILSSRCYACHGALRQKASLRLDTAALLRKGGDGGPAIAAGKSGDSLLIDAVTGDNGVLRMPPANEGPALSAKEIAILKNWIDQGAKAPDEPTPEDPRRHWAFRAPVRPPLPKSDPRNPIDAFLAAEYGKHGLQPAPAAARETLLRRVALDLTGLPPTREELHAFLADTSDTAYEKVVDRLLASPQYGERWGRHWMDVWRYSDWYGRRAVPDVWNSAPQIWRWRDWIVKSLNADKGYDRMVQEMLAGDEIAPRDDEVGVATGYLVRNWYALNPNQWMRDNVEHTAKAFLGLTMNCAHCHDHKYDPISQEEYFRFRAFFEPLDLRQDRWQGEPDPGPFQVYDYSKLRVIVPIGSVRVLDAKLDAKTYMYSLGDERLRMANRAPVTPGAPAFLEGNRLKIEPVQLPATAWYPGLKPWLQQAELERSETGVREAKESLQKAELALNYARAQQALLGSMTFEPRRPMPPTYLDANQQAPARLRSAEAKARAAEVRLTVAQAEQQALTARVAADNVRNSQALGNADEIARTAGRADRQFALRSAEERLLLAEADLTRDRANGTAPAKAEQQVAAAKAAVAAAQGNLKNNTPSYTPLSPVYPKTSTGRRTALAKWLTSRGNPLAARVAVNHIWLRHFDRVLVETVFDFGRNGKKPTHPELLDWLAVELMDSGWSMKKLHRLIVTSQAYRLASSVGDPNHPSLARDRDNRWLWRFPHHRLEAEAVRDSILYVSGELDLTIGGRVLENSQDTSKRRSLYFTVHPEEGGHLKFLETFDAPDPCDCYRRNASVMPQQALVLTNSRLLLDQSRLLARKLWGPVAAGPGDATAQQTAFIAAAFEQLLTRQPTKQEVSVCHIFLQRQAELVRKAKALPPDSADGSVPPATDPDMRARESLLRVLFNHDDFVTVR
jgi:Protein of unknown function (DUF1553)/Protein of unknown function (DUF1549)/Planctomycete cytochrome C